MIKHKTINIAGEEREYISRANPLSRQIKISIYPDGRLSLSRPRWVSEARAEKFLWSKRDWLAEKLKNIPRQTTKPINPTEDRKQRAQARKFVEAKLDYFNRYYDFHFQRVSIRDQRTRWGSCSKDGNLNFNYRLIFLPEALADYIIVHELCHLKEFNHSANFWALVARTLPDYKELRKRMRGALG